MIADENYRARWERKKNLYQKNGYEIRSAEEPAGRLIVTEDSTEKGLHSQRIETIVEELVNS